MNTTTGLDPFRRISFLERVDILRTTHGEGSPKSINTIGKLAKTIEVPEGWTYWLSCLTTDISISVWRPKHRAKTAMFMVTDCGLVLVEQGDYEYEGELDKVEPYLNKWLKGDFNELNKEVV